MVRCPKDVLGLYLDGRLKETEQKQLEEHLNSCPTCEYELGELRKLFVLLKPMDDPAPGSDFAAVILAAVDKEPAPIQFEIRRRQRLGRLLGIGAVLLGVGSVALLVNFIWGRVSPVLWNYLALLLGKVNLLVPEAIIEGIYGIESNGRVIKLIFEAVQDDSYLWGAVTAAGVFGWIMAKEIFDDLQRLVGLKK